MEPHMSTHRPLPHLAAETKAKKVHSSTNALVATAMVPVLDWEES